MNLPVIRTHKRLGFTLIELIVAAAIMGILVALIVVNISNAQRTARDGRRKSDVNMYVSALGSYKLVHQSYFVRAGDQSCSPTNNSTDNIVGPGCVGANGHSFGKMSLQASQRYSDEFPGNLYTYSPISIAQALKNGGFLGTIATDPLGKTVPTIDASQPDYILMRCVPGGYQSFNSNDVNAAVWTLLENKPSLVETENTIRYCGGSKAIPQGTNLPYYDFAANFKPTYNDTPVFQRALAAIFPKAYALFCQSVPTDTGGSPVPCGSPFFGSSISTSTSSPPPDTTSPDSTALCSAQQALSSSTADGRQLAQVFSGDCSGSTDSGTPSSTSTATSCSPLADAGSARALGNLSTVSGSAPGSATVSDSSTTTSSASSTATSSACATPSNGTSSPCPVPLVDGICPAEYEFNAYAAATGPAI